MSSPIVKRWGVETAPDQFDFVNAHDCRINSGCVVFTEWDDEDVNISVAYAAGQWATVHLTPEDEWPGNQL